jgi:hypothetical protein
MKLGSQTTQVSKLNKELENDRNETKTRDQKISEFNK